jgi:hypothetical protein
MWMLAGLRKIIVDLHCQPCAGSADTCHFEAHGKIWTYCGATI